MKYEKSVLPSYFISPEIQKNLQIKSSGKIFLIERSNVIAIISRYDCPGTTNFDLNYDKRSMQKELNERIFYFHSKFPHNYIAFIVE